MKVENKAQTEAKAVGASFHILFITLTLIWLLKLRSTSLCEIKEILLKSGIKTLPTVLLLLYSLEAYSTK